MKVELCKVSKIVTGGTPSTANSKYWNDGTIPWLQSGCCQNCYVTKASKYITKLGYDSSNTRLMPPDTILIALTGATAGKIGYLTFEACGNQSITGITPNTDVLLPKYLYYFLIARRRKTVSDCTGGAQPHISQEYVKHIEISLPSLIEQEKIIKQLDLLNDVIINENKNLVLQDELIKSRFNEMFGDPLQNEKGFNAVPLKELIAFNSVKGKVQISEETWLLNLDMVESNSGRVIEKLRTSKVDGSTIEFDTNCVLYSKLRPYLNKVVIPDESGFATSELVSLRCDSNKIKREYLATALRHQSFVDFINSKTAGAKMPRANMDELRKFKMPLPPIREQQEFSRFIAEIDKLKFTC